MTGAVFCAGMPALGAIAADAVPASDNAPARPNAVTAAFFRPFVFEVCFARDIDALPQFGCHFQGFNQRQLLRGKFQGELWFLPWRHAATATTSFARLHCSIFRKVVPNWDIEAGYERVVTLNPLAPCHNSAIAITSMSK